ncbi:MAG: oligoendopeptidase F [Chlamydiia bacterium]|nr:oligoendopeptidase F [Chlamydiia bacterium]
MESTQQITASEQINIEWDLSPLFNNVAECGQFINNIKMDLICNELDPLKESDISNASNIKTLLDIVSKYSRQIDKAYTYAHLLYDTSMDCHEAYKLMQTCINLYTEFSARTSWIDPKILSMPESTFNTLIDDPILSDYRQSLVKIYALKPYILSTNEEAIIAKLSASTHTTSNTFSILNDMEISFDDALDGKGEAHKINQTSYGKHIKASDRVLRKNAFESLYNGMKKYNLTIGCLLLGHANQISSISKIRKFKSSLSQALTSNLIDIKVYYNLLDTIKSNMNVLHELFAAKKTLLGLKDFSSYDTLAPLVHCKESISFHDALQITLNALAPLGEEYCNTLKQGILEKGWIHLMPSSNKRSGAYSSGCYDSMPYILLNFLGTSYDIFILAHEAGHSMHSHYSVKNQSYSSHDYPIFLAEIASTVNEILLAHYIKTNNPLGLAQDALQQEMEMCQSTLYRQAMFAEFEEWMHRNINENIVNSSDDLNNKYIELVKTYMGDAVNIEDYVKYEWSRIPHFYSPFYVFQYSTGICIAKCIANRIIKNEPGFKERYIAFLSSGQSQSPKDLLIKLDIDIEDSKYIQEAIDSFRKSIKEMIITK